MEYARRAGVLDSGAPVPPYALMEWADAIFNYLNDLGAFMVGVAALLAFKKNPLMSATRSA